MDFKQDALVWAKMKNWSPWPAKISVPSDKKSARTKAKQQFVYFFGTHNYAWVKEENIFPHSRTMLEGINNSKKFRGNMKIAVRELEIESRKNFKNKKPVQVKMEPSEEISMQHNTTTKISKMLSANNNLVAVEIKPRKQHNSEISSNSKGESLQVEKNKKEYPEVRVKPKPLDSSGEKGLKRTTAKDQVSIKRNARIKKKVKRQLILDTTSEDFKNDSTQVEKKCKWYLGAQVKKSPKKQPNKMSMKLQNAPKTPKKKTTTNYIQVRGQNPKVKVISKSTQACSKKAVPVKSTRKSSRIETLRCFTQNPVIKVEQIKKEPVFEKGNTTKKATPKKKTGANDPPKQCSSGMASDLTELITGIKTIETKKSSRVSDLENESKKQPIKVIMEKKQPAMQFGSANDKCSIDKKSPELVLDSASPAEIPLEVDLHLYRECKNPCASTSRENPMFFNQVSKTVGFLGVGRMGNLIIKNLIESGYTVIAWNRSMSGNFKEVLRLGAKMARNPLQVVGLCDIIFCCVLDANAVQNIAFDSGGVLEGFMNPNNPNKGTKIYVEMSSVDSAAIKEVAEVMTDMGVRYLEAPMIGSIQQAISKDMVVIAGGNYNLFQECLTYFSTFASRAVFAGHDIGSASKINLVNSMIFGTTCAVLGEAVGLAKSCNMSKSNFLQAIRNGPLNCPLIMQKANAMYDSIYTVEDPIKHQQKKLVLVMSMNKKNDQPLPLAAQANEAYKRAINYYPEEDVAAVHQNYV